MTKIVDDRRRSRAEAPTPLAEAVESDPLIEEARIGLDNYAYGPGAGMVRRLAIALKAAQAALLAGPPEPTEEEVYDAIAMHGTERLTPQANVRDAARRVQQLYRSKRHG